MGPPVRFWYDTEFYENGSTIRPISFGMVAEDGRELYMENLNFDWGGVPKLHWIQDNVRPYLRGGNHAFPYYLWGPAIHQFMLENSPVGRHELWGYYSAYDHVVLAQAFGTMMDLPPGIPMFTHDVKQWASQLQYNQSFPVHQGTLHNALDDAKWTRDVWKVLKKYETESQMPYEGTINLGGIPFER